MQSYEDTVYRKSCRIWHQRRLHRQLCWWCLCSCLWPDESWPMAWCGWPDESYMGSYMLLETSLFPNPRTDILNVMVFNCKQGILNPELQLTLYRGYSCLLHMSTFILFYPKPWSHVYVYLYTHAQSWIKAIWGHRHPLRWGPLHGSGLWPCSPLGVAVAWGSLIFAQRDLCRGCGPQLFPSREAGVAAGATQTLAAGSSWVVSVWTFALFCSCHMQS